MRVSNRKMGEDHGFIVGTSARGRAHGGAPMPVGKTPFCAIGTDVPIAAVILCAALAAGQALPMCAPRSRPVTREALPAPCCCRPVVLPVKIGPTLPAPCRRAAGQDRLPTCRAAGPTLPARGAAGPSLGKHCRPVVLPTCRAPGRSLGKRCRPVVLPVKIGPTLPAPLPTCRAAGPAGCIGRDAGSLGDVAARSCQWCRLWRFCGMRRCPALDS